MNISIYASIKLQSLFVLLLSLLIMVLGFGSIINRQYIHIQGIIKQSYTECSISNNLQCTTKYLIATSNGDIVYIATSNSYSLKTSLPIGTYINVSSG